VAAVVIVLVEPASQRLGPGLFGTVDADVGPLLQQGAVEVLDLAVGLRAVGPGEAMADAGSDAEPSEASAAVGGPVVGEQRAHHDAMVREPRPRPFPESHDRFGPLVPSTSL